MTVKLRQIHIHNVQSTKESNLHAQGAQWKGQGHRWASDRIWLCPDMFPQWGSLPSWGPPVSHQADPEHWLRERGVLSEAACGNGLLYSVFLLLGWGHGNPDQHCHLSSSFRQLNWNLPWFCVNRKGVVHISLKNKAVGRNLPFKN